MIYIFSCTSAFYDILCMMLSFLILVYFHVLVYFQIMINFLFLSSDITLYLSLKPHSITPYHIHKWMAGFQPRAGDTGSLGSIPSGTQSLIYPPPPPRTASVFSLSHIRPLCLPCLRFLCRLRCRPRPSKVDTLLILPPF